MNVLNYAAAAGLFALIVYLMIVGNAILLPLVIAVFVWYLINALASVTRGMRFRGRSLPKSVRLGGAVVIFVAAAWFLLNLVIGNIHQVNAAAPIYEQNLRQLADRAGERVGMEYMSRVKALFDNLEISNLIRRLGFAAAGVIGSVGTIAIYVAFLLLEQHSFDKKVAALFPDPGREATMRRILQQIGNEIQTYVWLKTLTSLMTGVGSYLVMKIIGVDFAEFWALVIFALNFIPYIGAMLGVIFPTVLALVQFDTITPFLVTAVTLTVIQFTIGSILEPRLMGKGLNLSPVVMLLSLAVWGAIWGITGMFLAVPLMVVVMIVCSHFQATRPIAVLMSADGELRT